MEPLFAPLILYLPQVQGDPGREESSKLLQEELAKLSEKGPERGEVLKVQQAVVVLQARQVLAALLISWPTSGPRLSTTFLGGLDPTQYLCLLDLLSHHQPKEQCRKVLPPYLFCELKPVRETPPLVPPYPSGVLHSATVWGEHGGGEPGCHCRPVHGGGMCWFRAARAPRPCTGGRL